MKPAYVVAERMIYRPMKRRSHMEIVGLCGNMKSGKTTIANMLKYNYPDKIIIMSFAYAVRQQVASGMGITYNELLDIPKNTVRPILQAWGNQMREIWGEDYWVEALQQEIEYLGGNRAFPTGNVVYVIDDVRYINEVEWIIDNGGYVFRLNCDEETRVARGADPQHLHHKSETDLDNFYSYHLELDTANTPPELVYLKILEVLKDGEIV